MRKFPVPSAPTSSHRCLCLRLPTSTTETRSFAPPRVQAPVRGRVQERAEELTTTTTSTTTSTTSSTVPFTRLADFHPDTKCQEWFQTAITVGWPNNTETLEKLGRLLWKETRCQNVSYTHPRFNGHDHGVAQINQIHRKYVEQLFDMPMEESMSDPTLNLRFAFLLYSDIAETGGCGWKPWRLC